MMATTMAMAMAMAMMLLVLMMMCLVKAAEAAVIGFCGRIERVLADKCLPLSLVRCKVRRVREKWARVSESENGNCYVHDTWTRRHKLTVVVPCVSFAVAWIVRS